MADEKQSDERTWEDTVDATMADIESRGDEEEATEEVVPAGEPEAVEPEPASEAETKDAPAVEKTEETIDSDQREDEAVEAAEQTESESSVEEPARDVPASWSPAIKDEWTQLPSAIQETILKREADFQKGLQQYAERSKSYDEVETILEPIKQKLNLSGHTSAQYLQQMVAVDRLLQTQPLEGLKYVAQVYGIGLDQLSPVADQVDEYQDPQLTAVNSKVDTLENLVHQQQQAIDAQAASPLQAQIDAFKTDPKHPHFEKLKVSMGRAMLAAEEEGVVMNMEQAYENAMWGDPELRGEMQAQQALVVAEKRKKETQDKALKAKKAASVNVSSNGTGKGANPRSETWEQTADRTAKEIAARG